MRTLAMVPLLIMMTARCGNYSTEPAGGAWPPGIQAALTLEYDGGHIDHWREVAPELETYGWRGTFNIRTDIIPNAGHWLEWGNVAARGHEIANHTRNHPSLITIPEDSVRQEIVWGLGDLETLGGITDVPGFSYPFGKDNQRVRDITAEYHTEARGGREDGGGDHLNHPGAVVWMDLESFDVRDCDTTAIFAWIDSGLEAGAWVILLFHVVGDLGPVTPAEHTAVLDYIQARPIWVARRRDVADRLRKPRGRRGHGDTVRTP